MTTITSARRAFLDQEPPPGYVPGLGRGAVGFTTRLDVGPAGPEDGVSGPSEGPTPAEAAEDAAADAVWTSVEDRLASRRGKRREAIAQAAEERARILRGRPKVQEQFADARAALATVTEDAWEALPDATDQVRPRQKRKTGSETYVPVPDHIIAAALQEGSITNSIAPDEDNDEDDDENNDDEDRRNGYGSRTGSGGGRTDLGQLGAARSKLLDMSLSGVASSVSGQSREDAAGYLTGLSTQRSAGIADIGDVKKARLLLRSVRSAEPQNANAWIGSARVEEQAGQLGRARKIILRGTEAVPGSEHVWLEAARLHSRDAARRILAEAVRHVPTSVDVWFRAADLEDDESAKRRVLRRALEQVPGSARLWKAAVLLEKPEHARLLLRRAVECVPQAAELWLALARLEPYEQAQGVLNAACEALPTEPSIWLAAACLEEAHSTKAQTSVPKIVSRAFRKLRNTPSANRSFWIAEAERCHTAEAPLTAHSIISLVMSSDKSQLSTSSNIPSVDSKPSTNTNTSNDQNGGNDQNENQKGNVEEGLSSGVESLKDKWMKDIEGCVGRGSVGVARDFYEGALAEYPEDGALWLGLVQLEKRAGAAAERVDALLERAVAACPGAEALWLARAVERREGMHDVAGARRVLQLAFGRNPRSEKIWLEAVRLEAESGEPERARALLTRARTLCGSERVWLRSALLEHSAGNTAAEAELLDNALTKFPTSASLWYHRLLLAQRSSSIQSSDTQSSEGKSYVCKVGESARDIASRALSKCPKSVALWQLAAKCEEEPARARAVLERGRTAVPGSDVLWLAGVRVERAAGQSRAAEALLAKGIQACPRSGLLWAETVLWGTGGTAKSRAADALRQCEDDPHVLVAVAVRVFWAERKIPKARAWIQRALERQPDLGDAWAWAVKFERENGTEQSTKEVVEACIRADPKKGEIWTEVAMDPDNRDLSTEKILFATVQRLPEVESIGKSAAELAARIQLK